MPPILVEGDAMARFFLDSLLSFDGGVRGGRISPIHLFTSSPGFRRELVDYARLQPTRG